MLKKINRNSGFLIEIIEFRSAIQLSDRNKNSLFSVLIHLSMFNLISALQRKNLYRLEFPVTYRDFWQFCVLGFLGVLIKTKAFSRPRERRKPRIKNTETIYFLCTFKLTQKTQSLLLLSCFHFCNT